MIASPDRRGMSAAVAALAIATALASPAWAQTQQGEQAPAQAVQPSPAPSQTGQADAAAGQAGQAAEAADPAAGDRAGQPSGDAQTEGAAETEAQPEPAATKEAGAAAGAGPDYLLGDVALGDPEAPVTVVEYASFTCPHCATFHTETFPEFREKYIDTGKVRFVLREVYFDQYGLWASMVARCGGEQGFYPLVDAFLSSQSTWTRAPDIGHAIQQVGRRAGLPAARLEQCLSDRDFAKALLEDYQEHREADEIQSTPTFVIDGEKHTGAMGFEEFSAIVDAAM